MAEISYEDPSGWDRERLLDEVAELRVEVERLQAHLVSAINQRDACAEQRDKMRAVLKGTEATLEHCAKVHDSLPARLALRAIRNG